MSDYQTDRNWSDQFIPTIKQIVGPYLLVPSSFEVDTKHASDLVVLKARDMMIAARIRRAGYAERYGYEFTIRSKRDNGAITELTKIVDRWGDWFLYGHEGDAGELSRWFLIDLDVFRANLIRRKDKIRKGMKDNRDGTYFAWFDIRCFTPNILVASSHGIEFICN